MSIEPLSGVTRFGVPEEHLAEVVDSSTSMTDKEAAVYWMERWDRETQELQAENKPLRRVVRTPAASRLGRLGIWL